MRSKALERVMRTRSARLIVDTLPLLRRSRSGQLSSDFACSFHGCELHRLPARLFQLARRIAVGHDAAAGAVARPPASLDFERADRHRENESAVATDVSESA